jgi:hypothetical protein
MLYRLRGMKRSMKVEFFDSRFLDTGDMRGVDWEL